MTTPAEQLSEAEREMWRDMACAMYEAYGDSVGWKAVSGHPMPPFSEVGPRVEGAWCIAARHGSAFFMEKAAREFVEKLGRAPAPAPVTAEQFFKGSGSFNDFHVMNRARAAVLKMAMHKAVEGLFERIQYDDDGNAVNAITVEQKKDFVQLALPKGRLVNIPHRHSLSIAVDESAEGFEEALRVAREH